jgi:hypothetical protein
MTNSTLRVLTLAATILLTVQTIGYAQLAVLPGGDHFMLFHSPDRMLAILMPFLGAPLPEPGKSANQ